MPADFDDAAIIRAILAGKVESFEVLLDRYQAEVALIVRKHVPPDRVPEVAQDIFVRVYQSLGNYRGTHPFGHWLARLAVRGCHDFWREYYRQRETPLSGLSEACRTWVEEFLADPGPEAETQRRETRELLDWALGQLSAAERMVLTLAYLEEYPLAEAAELLGWSLARVKVQSYRARRKLRRVLEKVLPERNRK